jgi:hypothetical protein
LKIIKKKEMEIKEYVSRYENHPVLFMGTGISLRYLENAYTWDGLLGKIAFELKGTNEYYLDLKSECQEEGKYILERVASRLEIEFNNVLKNDRNGKFKTINDAFYENMKNGLNLSRFKIYISELLNELQYKKEMLEEISELKKTRKNIGSIITTNYDKLIEDTFEFNELIGNNILVSNPYGSVYKIHGCITNPEKIIINENDYFSFDEKYELIRAQLLSLFIHNPIIFLGYNIGDENIKKILKTIFTYVPPNSKLAERIRNNFLLIEFEKDSDNLEITEHDIDMEGFSTVRINKIKTDNYIEIYKALSEIHLPISAMDVRKVQSIVKEIYSGGSTGGSITVSITEDLDSLKNSAKILAFGTSKTITYQFQTSSEMMVNYFKIVDESNKQILTLIDKYSLQKNQYFPIFGFDKINSLITLSPKLKEYQETNLENAIKSTSVVCQKKHETIEGIMDDPEISNTNKENAIFWAVMNGNIDLDIIENYLRNHSEKKSTNYRKILCAYDKKRYGETVLEIADF